MLLAHFMLIWLEKLKELTIPLRFVHVHRESIREKTKISLGSTSFSSFREKCEIGCKLSSSSRPNINNVRIRLQGDVVVSVRATTTL